MKILEAQSAVLTNWEVYSHLVEEQEQRANKPGQRRRRGPLSLETTTREVIAYLRTYPSPLSQNPEKHYGPEVISRLLERLRPCQLLKGEMVMIFNLRPVSAAVLSTIVEGMTERFTEEQQDEILLAISEVLGRFEGKAGDTEEEVQDNDVEV